MPLAKALQGTLGGFLPTGTGGGGGGPLNILPPLYHSGGTMGEPSGFRMVPASIFAGAPRFHSGIGPGELPAILRHDESVLTPKQMAQLAPNGGWGGGGPSNQQVNIHNYSGGQVKTQRRQSGNTSVTDIVIGEAGDGIAKGRFDTPMAARYGSRVKAISR